MSRLFEPTPEELSSWAEFLATRPDTVRSVAERFPPWEIFIIRQTEQPVYVVAYVEDGTVQVARDPEIDWLAGVYHEVFGIDPNDLIPGEPRLLN